MNVIRRTISKNSDSDSEIVFEIHSPVFRFTQRIPGFMSAQPSSLIVIQFQLHIYLGKKETQVQIFKY